MPFLLLGTEFSLNRILPGRLLILEVFLRLSNTSHSGPQPAKEKRHREGHVTTEAAMGSHGRPRVWPRPETGRAARNRSPLRAPKKGPALPTPRSWASHLQSWEGIDVCGVKCPHLWHSVMAAVGNEYTLEALSQDLPRGAAAQGRVSPPSNWRVRKDELGVRGQRTASGGVDGMWEGPEVSEVQRERGLRG